MRAARPACERCAQRAAVWNLYSEHSTLLCGPCVLTTARRMIENDETDQRLMLDLLQ